MTDRKQNEELNAAELDNVQGGIGLLLPAVQKVRESASNTGNIQLETQSVKGKLTGSKAGIRASKLVPGSSPSDI